MWGRQKGFTIVELLIVIVVIGILAAITIVAYGNIQSRAKYTASQAALGQYIKTFQMIKADVGSLPAGAGAGSACLGPAPQPEICGIAGQNATASSSNTVAMKTLLAQYGMNSQSAVGNSFSGGGYLVYTSSFYGEPALLWQMPVDQDCVSSPARFVQSGNVWTDGVKYSARTTLTTCYMSLSNL